MADTDELLTVEQLRARLNVTRTTLYHWRKAGDGPPEYRLGKSKAIRFKASEVEAWLTSKAAS